MAHWLIDIALHIASNVSRMQSLFALPKSNGLELIEFWFKLIQKAISDLQSKSLGLKTDWFLLTSEESISYDNQAVLKTITIAFNKIFLGPNFDIENFDVFRDSKETKRQLLNENVKTIKKRLQMDWLLQNWLWN